MKGIIIAGGTGSRLYPITKVVNKHLLPVYNKPLIYYPLNTLIKAGISDIIIIAGPESIDQFKRLLAENGQFKNINFIFAVQKEAGGIAQALGLCQPFIGKDQVAVILGDNVIEDNLAETVSRFAKTEQGAQVFLKKVNDPGRYTIAALADDKIVSIEEKPSSPKSDLAIVGLYLFDQAVWQVISGLQPSVRGELEITEVITYYLKNGKLGYEILAKDWFDIDTFSTLWEANAAIHKTAQ